MGPVILPAVGAQTRRRSDGILGEVYSTDPSHNLLSVRWATVPGAYGHDDFTVEQFSRVWELTGVLVEPPRETYVALALIVAIVLSVLCAILVHNAGPYLGYDKYRPIITESPNLINDARALHDRYGLQAAEACASGADEYIRSITQHRFHWTESNLLEPRFDHFNPVVSAPGVLTLSTSKPVVSNGFGVFTPITVYCNYDTQSSEVLSYTSGNED